MTEIVEGESREVPESRAIVVSQPGQALISNPVETGATDMPTIDAPRPNGVLRVGVNDGNLPFAGTKDGRMTGFDIELVERFAASLGSRDGAEEGVGGAAHGGGDHERWCLLGGDDGGSGCDTFSGADAGAAELVDGEIAHEILGLENTRANRVAAVRPRAN